jgi:hypothetical protein
LCTAQSSKPMACAENRKALVSASGCRTALSGSVEFEDTAEGEY